MNAENCSRLLEIAGRGDGLDEVIEHRISDAWREGALAVSGRLEPRFFDDGWWRMCFQDGSS